METLTPSALLGGALRLQTNPLFADHNSLASTPTLGVTPALRDQVAAHPNGVEMVRDSMLLKIWERMEHFGTQLDAMQKVSDQDVVPRSSSAMAVRSWSQAPLPDLSLASMPDLSLASMRVAGGSAGGSVMPCAGTRLPPPPSFAPTQEEEFTGLGLSRDMREVDNGNISQLLRSVQDKAAAVVAGGPAAREAVREAMAVEGVGPLPSIYAAAARSPSKSLLPYAPGRPTAPYLMEMFADKSKAGIAGSYELEVTNAGLKPVLHAAPRTAKRLKDDELLQQIPTAVRYMRVHESMQAIMILNDHLVPGQYKSYQAFLVVMAGLMRQFDESDGWLFFLLLDRDLRVLQWEQNLDWSTAEGLLDPALHTSYLVKSLVAQMARGGSGASGSLKSSAPGKSFSGPGECRSFAKSGVCSKGAGCKYTHACGLCGSSAHGSGQHDGRAGQA
jgi:hypothetical protein